MSVEYVVNNATLMCSNGSGVVQLVVIPERNICMEERHVANKSDMRVENIGLFGTCAATNQAPCFRRDASLTPWIECKEDVIVAGHPAVLTTSFLMCKAGGGMITVSDSGQEG